MDNSTELHKKLTELSKEKNKIHFSEFERYSPLYRSDTDLSNAELRELSEEFISRVDPYENIEIIDSRGESVITLPRLMNPTKSIGKEFEAEKANFRKQSIEDAPRHRADAVKGIVNSFRASAQDPEYVESVKDRIQEFDKLNEEFLSRKTTDVEAEKIETETEKLLSPDDDTEFVWEIK